MENDSVYDVLDSCCHEAYHSYQHRLVDAYNLSEDNLRELRIYNSAGQYAQEFRNYNNGARDFTSYFFQYCEMDAREYAESAVLDYYMAEHIERTALPAASVTVQFEGQSEPMEFRYAYYHEHKLSLHAQFGKAEKFRLEPAVPGLLRGILASEQEYRHNFIPGVFENHLDQMIAAEKRSVTHFLKEAAANAPRPAPNKKTKEQPQR